MCTTAYGRDFLVACVDLVQYMLAGIVQRWKCSVISNPRAGYEDVVATYVRSLDRTVGRAEPYFREVYRDCAHLTLTCVLSGDNVTGMAMGCPRETESVAARLYSHQQITSMYCLL